MAILEAYREAMQVIRNKFETGEVFTPELMPVGEMLSAISEKVKPLLKEEGAESKKSGKIS